MHGRRYWIKALDAGDQRAALPIAAYKYQIEAETKDYDAGAELAERILRSKPVFDELIAWRQRARLTSRRRRSWGRDPLHAQQSRRAGPLARGRQYPD